MLPDADLILKENNGIYVSQYSGFTAEMVCVEKFPKALLGLDGQLCDIIFLIALLLDKPASFVLLHKEVTHITGKILPGYIPADFLGGLHLVLDILAMGDQLGCFLFESFLGAVHGFKGKGSLVNARSLLCRSQFVY